MKTTNCKSLPLIALGFAIIPILGCLGGDARVEIATANLIDVATDSFAGALAEYHQEILAADAKREQEVIQAFTTRLAQSEDGPLDPVVIENHKQDFARALTKLRADTETEWQRHMILTANLKTLQDAATTMRKLAVDSLSLEDETKRYLSDALVQLKEFRSRESLRQDAANSINSP